MLFSILLGIYALLIASYIGIVLANKKKHFGFSIVVRILTLTLFACVIFDHYESEIHFIVLLLLWVGFESFENFLKKKIASAPTTSRK